MWARGEVLSGGKPFGNGRPTVNRGGPGEQGPGSVAVIAYNRNITAASPAKPAPVRLWLAWLGVVWADLPQWWQGHPPRLRPYGSGPLLLPPVHLPIAPVG